MSRLQVLSYVAKLVNTLGYKEAPEKTAAEVL